MYWELSKQKKVDLCLSLRLEREGPKGIWTEGVKGFTKQKSREKGKIVKGLISKWLKV